MALFGRKKEEKMSMPAPPVGTMASENKSFIPERNQNNLQPPMLGGLDDIKNEISKPVSDRDITLPSLPVNETEAENSNNDDSLFDFADLEMNSSMNNDFFQENVDNEDNISNNESSQLNETDLHFLDNKSQKISESETYFVTTKQFKSLLEIVENVKTKIKEASETHLRLLDIKAEEDIEYENLRKDFAFIEDKLYEVDSLIFDK